MLSTVVPTTESSEVRLRILPVALVKEKAVVVALLKIPLVKEAEVEKREDEVPEVSTVEEARSVPGRVRVFTADR